jgi:hypothetical protein
MIVVARSGASFGAVANHRYAAPQRWGRACPDRRGN